MGALHSLSKFEFWRMRLNETVSTFYVTPPKSAPIAAALQRRSVTTRPVRIDNVKQRSQKNQNRKRKWIELKKWKQKKTTYNNETKKKKRRQLQQKRREKGNGKKQNMESFELSSWNRQLEPTKQMQMFYFRSFKETFESVECKTSTWNDSSYSNARWNVAFINEKPNWANCRH